MEELNEIPDYDQDSVFDEDIDITGITCLVSIIGATVGAGLGFIILSTYYFIKNNF